MLGFGFQAWWKPKRGVKTQSLNQNRKRRKTKPETTHPRSHNEKKSSSRKNCIRCGTGSGLCQRPKTVPSKPPRAKESHALNPTPNPSPYSRNPDPKPQTVNPTPQTLGQIVEIGLVRTGHVERLRPPAGGWRRLVGFGVSDL